MSIPHNPVILDPFRKGAVFIQSNLTFRQLRRWFGRVALTLLVTLLATQLLSYGSVVAWQTLVGPLSYTMLMVLNDITIYLPCLVLIPLMLRRIPRADPIPDAALSGQERFLALVFSLGSGYLFSYATIALISLLEQLLGQTSSNAVSAIESALPPVASVIAFAIVAPIAEEFIFRRLLLDRIRIFGDGAAILIGGAAFGLFHGNLNQTLYAFALGAVFTAIVLMTNRIRYTLAIHMVINGISVLTTFGPSDWLLYPISMVILFSVLFSIVLFFVRRKRYTFEPGPLPFTRQEKVRACFTSPWVWILLVGGLAFSGVSIFL